MRNRLGLVFGAAVGLLMASGSLFAHHSEAMLDKDHLITIKGTIVDHEFINPHQLIHMKVKDADGRVTQWTIQGTPPGALRDVGWTSNTLKPGDEVALTAYVCRDGRPCGSWVRIVKADGKAVPLPNFKKEFLGEYLEKHGKELSREEYEVYKASIAGVVVRTSTPPRQADNEKY